MLRLIMLAFSVFAMSSSSLAGMRDALPDQYGRNAPLPDQRGADYRLPYGTYSGNYANWRTYGLVGDRIAQYGPLSNKGVPRWKYNVRTGDPSGFDLKTR